MTSLRVPCSLWMADLRPTVRCHDSGGPARLLQEDRGPGAAGQEDPGVQGAA